MDGSGDIALGYSLSGTEYLSIGGLRGAPGNRPARIPVPGRNTDDRRQQPLKPRPRAGAITACWRSIRWMTAPSGTPRNITCGAAGSNWRTRIGAFKFPSCAQPDTGLLQGTVRSAAGNLPVSGAKVDLGGTSVFTGADGSYQVVLPVGPVNVQVSAFGYLPQTSSASDHQRWNHAARFFAGSGADGERSGSGERWIRAHRDGAVCAHRYRGGAFQPDFHQSGQRTVPGDARARRRCTPFHGQRQWLPAVSQVVIPPPGGSG